MLDISALFIHEFFPDKITRLIKTKIEFLLPEIILYKVVICKRGISWASRKYTVN